MRSLLSVRRDGVWSYRAGRYGILRARVTLAIDGRAVASDESAVAAEREERRGAKRGKAGFSFGAGGVRADVRFESRRDHVLIQAAISNGSDRVVKLGQCCLLDAASKGCRIHLGTPANGLTFLAADGWCLRSQVVRLDRVSLPARSKTVGHVYSPDAGIALNTSFLTFDRANTEIQSGPHRSDPLAGYRAYCDFDGYDLRPGHRIRSEVLYVGLSADPHRTLNAYAAEVARHYRPRLWPKPPVGWFGGTWSSFEDRAERVVRRHTRAVRERLAGFDIDYVWISIVNLKDGLPGNWFRFNARVFPNGIAPLARRLRRQGFRMGLWIAPFWVCPEVKDQLERNRGNLLRMADGRPMVYLKKWSYGGCGDRPPDKRPDFYALDGSHPGTIRYLRDVFRAYRRMGVRYYMLDFLDAGSGSTPGVHPYDRYHDPRRIKGPEVYRNALRAIREAAGKDTYLLSSTGPTFQNIGMVHAVRTGNDFGEGRAVRKGTWFYPGTIALGAGEHLDWSSALRNMAANYFVHGRWYDNDAGNVLAVDKPLPLNQARVHATFFGIGGGPMMLGDDIDRIDEERLALIKKCLPRTAEVAVPLDLFTSCGPDDRPMVFRLDIRRPWGAYTILAVFNDRPGERARTLSVRQLGLAPSAIHQIYDFWNDSAWSFSGETLALAVAGNSVGLYRIQRRRSHPWLLSSDMHVLQGAVEVAELTWDARTKTLAGWVSRPRGEQGNLFFTAPEGWKPVDYEGLWVAKQAADRSILVKKHLVFRRERLRWSVRFERYT